MLQHPGVGMEQVGNGSQFSNDPSMFREPGRNMINMLALLPSSLPLRLPTSVREAIAMGSMAGEPTGIRTEMEKSDSRNQGAPKAFIHWIPKIHLERDQQV